MAKKIFFFYAIFLISLREATSQCDVSQIDVHQTNTGKVVKGKPEWRVTITNPCICTFIEIQLNCKGFQSAEKVDSSLLALSGDACLLTNGQPLHGKESTSFSYAWTTQFTFKPISATIGCS
ncbi:uncharacterized protein LOC131157080 [Malania oleifera]|uniref:uncharacterized protein LOC131157080 n=1 Tax=Malania oleifera TaxID=397392 RepID=UPI0025AE49D9|nr:uncharacterized protein LOC131157080 [Malania oleifera]